MLTEYADAKRLGSAKELEEVTCTNLTTCALKNVNKSKCEYTQHTPALQSNIYEHDTVSLVLVIKWTQTGNL